MSNSPLDSSTLEHALGELGNPRILIVGDLMLDRYVRGEVSRISPEAPIPVLAVRGSEERLGGAGNVAANLRAMEAGVVVCGLIGKDGWGDAVRRMLEESGADTSALVVDPNRRTIEKTRMVSGVQQMLRVDYEEDLPLDSKVEASLLKTIEKEMATVDAVVLSDYGKGVLTDTVLKRTIELARAAKKPVLVDPKGTDYSRYSGATLMTPNRKEAEEALGRRLKGLDQVEAGAQSLIDLANLDCCIITLGADGIFSRTKSGENDHAPAAARAVFDVTGAGDTVIAHLALYLGHGFDLNIAVGLANHAAGVVVARLGTNAVTRSELRAKLFESSTELGTVLVGDDLDQALAAWRKEGRRIVFTNGCFDILHAGHVTYLRDAKAHGDVLLVGVNDDASVRRLKGESRPVNTIHDRMVVLAALEMVDAVTSFGEDTPKDIIQRVTPDVLVKGEDWADKGVVGREWVESHGGVVHLAKLVPGRSTTNIIERAKSGN